MKRISAIIYALSSVLSAGTAANAQQPVSNAPPEPPAQYISAEIKTESDSVFFHQAFYAILEIKYYGYNLNKNFRFQPIPEDKAQRISDLEELSGERIKENGKDVEIQRFRWKSLAIATGIVEFSPMVNIGILKRVPDIFGYHMEETRADLTGKPFKLNIIPLPDTKLEFSGAVGQFALDVQASETDVAAGDVIKIISRISGTGYVNDIKPPYLKETPDFKIYQTEAINDPSNTQARIFQQSIVPQTTNTCTIPPSSFTYFDPYKKEYVTLSSKPIAITFHKQMTNTVKRFVPVQNEPSRIQTEERSPLNTVLAGAITAIAIYILILLIQAAMVRPFSFTNVRHLMIRVYIALAIIILVAVLYRAEKFKSSSRYLKEINMDCHGLIAPAESAMTSFSIPKGSLVKIVEHHGRWVKIELNDQRAWIFDSAIGK